jgi:hypothetical protein
MSEHEYRACLKEAEDKLFLFLGKAIVRGKGKQFVAFHRPLLESIGYSLDARQLSRAVRLALCDYIGNPKRSWDAFASRRRNVSLASRGVSDAEECV